jgi:hypothetical protein
MPDRDWNANFTIGELYYSPTGFEMVKVLELKPVDRWFRMKVEQLWQFGYFIERQDKIYVVEVPSKFTEGLVPYEKAKLLIMKRIFE